jgi:hypothetical protein
LGMCRKTTRPPFSKDGSVLLLLLLLLLFGECLLLVVFLSSIISCEDFASEVVNFGTLTSGLLCVVILVLSLVDDVLLVVVFDCANSFTVWEKSEVLSLIEDDNGSVLLVVVVVVDGANAFREVLTRGVVVADSTVTVTVKRSMRRSSTTMTMTEETPTSSLV